VKSLAEGLLGVRSRLSTNRVCILLNEAHI
jgi:hypothetical protein